MDRIFDKHERRVMKELILEKRKNVKLKKRQKVSAYRALLREMREEQLDFRRMKTAK